MASLDFSDRLSLAQTIAIIATLLMTLYFSGRQLKSFTLDMETRVLNDLDEKLHNMGSMFVDSPELIKTIYDIPSEITSDVPFAFYILFMWSHAYHMRERKILSDNEWAGWLQWIKNAFRYGTIGKYWKVYEMETWFDPSFQKFVNTEIIVPQPDSKQNGRKTQS